MTETSPQSKIQKTDNPPLPGTCIVCAVSYTGKQPFLDWNLSLDWYGAVLFCTDCAKEMLAELDFCPVAEREALKDEISVLYEQIAELKDANVRLDSTLDNLLSVRPALRGDGDPFNKVSHIDFETDESDSSEVATAVEPEASESEHGFVKSPPERGPKNVSQSKFAGS